MDALRKAGDSCGARIEVRARGVPVGLGEPLYDKLDADIAYAMMGINAVKGVEIGDGFGAWRSAAAARRRAHARGLCQQPRRRRAGRHQHRAGPGGAHRHQAHQLDPHAQGQHRPRRPADGGGDLRPPRPLRGHPRHADRRGHAGAGGDGPRAAPPRAVRRRAAAAAAHRRSAQLAAWPAAAAGAPAGGRASARCTELCYFAAIGLFNPTRRCGSRSWASPRWPSAPSRRCRAGRAWWRPMPGAGWATTAAARAADPAGGAGALLVGAGPAGRARRCRWRWSRRCCSWPTAAWCRCTEAHAGAGAADRPAASMPRATAACACGARWASSLAVTGFGALLERWASACSRLRGGDERAAAGWPPAAAGAHAAPARHGEPRRRCCRVLRQPAVAWFFASVFFTVLAHTSLYVFFSLYLVSLGYGKSAVGALWAVSVAVEIAFFWFQGRFFTGWGRMPGCSGWPR
jgi:hypothetical protein